MKLSVSLSTLIALAAMPSSPAVAEDGTAVLVRDADRSTQTVAVNPSTLFNTGDHLYFSGRTELTGGEIFRTDGTAEGTELVADLCRGRCGTDFRAIFSPVAFSGSIYWSACDRGGCQLWRLTETAAGTEVKAIYDAGGSLEVDHFHGTTDLVAWKDALYFTTVDGELRRTDGNGPGEVLVRVPGFRRVGALMPSRDVLYFIAYGWDGGLIDPPVAPPAQLWRSDGTAAGTSMLWDLAGNVFFGPVLVGEKLLFHAPDDNGIARFLVSDGTAVENLFDPPRFNSSVEVFQVIADQLYFGVDLGSGGEVWRTDLTAEGTLRMGDTRGGSIITPETIAYREELYFHIFSQSVLYKVPKDGTGTVAVFDFGDVISDFDVAGDTLYVTTGNTNGETLWRSRGTAESVAEVFSTEIFSVDGTPPVKLLGELHGDAIVSLELAAGRQSSLVRATAGGELVSLFGPEGASGDPRDLETLGRSLFFQTDGAEDGEVRLWRVPPGGSSARRVETFREPFKILKLAGKLYAFEPSRVRAVGAGGRLSPVFEPPSGLGLVPSTVFPLGDAFLFLTQGDSSFHSMLWRLDTGSREAVEVLDFARHFGFARAASLDGELLLLFLEAQVWRTDGTPEGTALVIDLEDTCILCRFDPVRVGDGVYFTDSDFFHRERRRLFRTDGTTEGTRVILEIEAGENPEEGERAASFPVRAPIMNRLTAAGGRLYFVVADVSVGSTPFPAEPQLTMGSELWTSDGTPEGTRLVRDIWLGRSSSDPQELIELDGRLVFTADDGVHGRELWTSDGTAEGTVLFHDLAPGSSPSQPHHLRRVDDVLVFAAAGDEGGAEPWAIDLDGKRPWRIEDVQPGPLGSDPRELTAAGGRLFFNAGRPESGFELWSVDRSLLTPPPLPRCDECVLDGRFAVTVEWKNHDGSRQGRGTPVPVTDETVAFWFFNPSNVELIVKVLDGRQVNGDFWVFSGALTDVEYTLRVEDLETGEVASYHNSAGNLCGRSDTGAFDGARLTGVKAPAACKPGPETLCLLDGRFRVEVAWTTGGGATGTGRARPATNEAGYFWFFNESNVELVVKMLDGRAINGHFWIFAAGLTGVEYEITVTDTATGEARVYGSPAGGSCGIGDTLAIPD